MSTSADVAITTVMLILIITCIVGNSFVCAVVMKNRDMRIPINYLLVNLAVADIMYSTFAIPPIFFIHNVSHPEGVAGRVLCALLTGGNISWIGAYASVFTLIAIAIERYFAVVYPHGHKGKLTMRKLKVIVPVSWIVGLILQLPAFLDKSVVKKRNSCFFSEKWSVQATDIMYYVYVLLACALLAVLYYRVVYTLWFKRNDVNTVTYMYQQQGVLKVRKRVTLMVVTVSAIFAISYGTDVILHTLNDHVGSIKLGPYAFAIAHTMIMFNFAVNPFAYALISQRFRERMKEMICCSSAAPAREQQDIQMTNNIST